MEKTITLDGIEYNLSPVKKGVEFMPKPKIGDKFWFIKIGHEVIESQWDNDNIDNKRYNILNVYLNESHAEAMSELSIHHKAMLMKYGFCRKISWYYFGDEDWQDLFDKDYQFEQIFSPLYISAIATKEEKTERVRLIKQLLPFLPLK